MKLVKSREENISYLFNNKEEFEKSKKFLKDFDKYEEDLLKLVMKKNELEGFIFKLKEVVDDDFKKNYLSQKEMDSFLNKS